MNILITGASGFLGKAVLDYYKYENREDDKIWLLTSNNIPGYNCILHRDYHFKKDDIIDAGLRNIDCLLHMGASVPQKREEFGTDYAYKFSKNIINTAYLLENLPELPTQIVFTSSVSIYNNEPYISEETPIQIEDMYGASKLMCESYLKQLASEKGVRLQILRLGQLYGEGEETYAKIVSSFVKGALFDKKIMILGKGNELRTMLYIKDCVRYIIDSMHLDQDYGPINITGNREITIIDIANKVYSSFGLKPNICFNGDTSGKSITYNSEKMNSIFNYEQTSYDEGISNYCHYFASKYGGLSND